MVSKIFEILAVLFDKIPFLHKIKGGRFILGCVALAVVVGLQQYGIGNPEMTEAIKLGLLGFCGLALNAKGRE